MDDFSFEWSCSSGSQSCPSCDQETSYNIDDLLCVCSNCDYEFFPRDDSHLK